MKDGKVAMNVSHAYGRAVDNLIRLALEEDLPAHDVTTEAVLQEPLSVSANLLGKEAMVVSGLEVAQRVFRALDAEVVWEAHVADSFKVEAGSVLARVSGNAAALLAGERTALNFLQRLSGIATATRRAVDEVESFHVAVMDTRKTTPGWRLLEKSAVRDGGGMNHRFSLSDGVLIKGNHVKLCGGVGAALARARTHLPPGTRVEVEVGNLEEVREGLDAGAGVILLDNSDPQTVAQAVSLVKDRALLEASGGITERNIRRMAETGVRQISLGALTHSAASVDISMEIL